MTDFIFKFFPEITSLGPWLSKKRGILLAVILGEAFAFLFMGAGLIPTAPADPEATTFPWWEVGYIVVFPLVVIVLWFIVTQVYLRSGQGTKIGLAYDGHAVDIRDWKRTKNKLRDLLKNGQINNNVTLKFVPLSYCTDDKLAKKVRKRYGFSILTTVHQSPLVENDANNAQHPIPTKINLNIATKEEEVQFIHTTFKYALEVINLKRKKTPTLADVLDANAQDLHDMMLIFVASLCYLHGEFEDSAVILKFLDDSLSSMIAPTRNPRDQIRKLAMNCYLQPSRFLIKDIPGFDKLREICAFAEKALPFFDNSYYVASEVGRIRVLTGDIDGAVEITERLKVQIKAIEETDQKVNPRAVVINNLNTGFLSFIQGYWGNAYEGYRSMLATDEYPRENWHEIIEFIDYVDTLECYEGICYLRTLYRLIANQAVPDELRAAAQDWCDQDRSREELGTLLLRRYPRRSPKPQQPNTKVKKQSKRVKQRSKRKRKTRNNKRKKR